MRVKVGDKLPNVLLFEGKHIDRVTIERVSIADLSAGKKVIVFAVPGAFSPGCSQTHLPGYVSKAEDFKRRGVEEIICVSVNDPFVMDAWGTAHKATGKIRMLADPSGEFTKALELQTHMPSLGGLRSKRYSMVLVDGVVKTLNIEPDGTGLSCSLAEKIKI